MINIKFVISYQDKWMGKSSEWYIDVKAFKNWLKGNISQIEDAVALQVNEFRYVLYICVQDGLAYDELEKKLRAQFILFYNEKPVNWISENIEGIKIYNLNRWSPVANSDFREPCRNQNLGAIENTIEHLFSAKPFKELMWETKKISPEIVKLGMRDVFVSQNYLFSINNGCGLTTYLEIMSRYFKLLGLIPENDTSYPIEISLEMPGTGRDLSIELLKKIMENLETNKELRIICIDISNWLDHLMDQNFEKLIETISNNNQQYIFVFRVPVLEDSAIAKIKSVLRDRFTTRILKFMPFTDKELFGFLERKFYDRGFTYGEHIYLMFLKQLAREKSDGRFYGLKSIEKIANQLLYNNINRIENRTLENMRIEKSDFRQIIDEDELNSHIDGKSELENLIGLLEVKDRIREIVETFKYIQSARMNENGMKIDQPCLHMMFTGSTGTGKTTVGRILGKILKEEGILLNGCFIEISGRDLIGKYVGQTAPITSEICRSAYGSVLFIDEAYTLFNGNNDNLDYGREALATLVAEMENNRDKMVVILAGYEKEMTTMLKGNVGLKERIPHRIHFKDYDAKELIKIFSGMATQNGICIDKIQKPVHDYLKKLNTIETEEEGFGNARFVRNLYERVLSKAILRQQFSAKSHEQFEFLPVDFKSTLADREFYEKTLEVEKISFGFKS